MHPFLQLPRPTDFSVSSLLTAGNGGNAGSTGSAINSSVTAGNVKILKAEKPFCFIENVVQTQWIFVELWLEFSPEKGERWLKKRCFVWNKLEPNVDEFIFQLTFFFSIEWIHFLIEGFFVFGKNCHHSNSIYFISKWIFFIAKRILNSKLLFWN